MEDDLFLNAKLGQVSEAAIGVYCLSITYCANRLTDGLVPKVAWNMIRASDTTAAELVAAGLWEEREDGHEVHDFLDYNPSRKQVETRRRERSESGRRGGHKSALVRRNEATAKAPPQAKPKQSSTPDPVPVPEVKEPSRSTNLFDKSEASLLREVAALNGKTIEVVERFKLIARQRPKGLPLDVNVPAMLRVFEDFAHLEQLPRHCVNCAEWLGDKGKKRRSAVRTLRHWLENEAEKQTKEAPSERPKRFTRILNPS